MDQGASRIDEDLKDILHTRMAIADKVEQLERHVQERVERTRRAAMDTVSHVKDTAADLVEQAAQKLDPVRQIEQRPWTMLAGAVAIGYLAGILEERARRGGVYPYYPPGADAASVMPPPGQSAEEGESGVYGFYPSSPSAAASGPAAAQERRDRSVAQELGQELVQEIDHLKYELVEAGRSWMRVLFREIIPSLIKTPEGRGTGGVR